MKNEEVQVYPNPFSEEINIVGSIDSYAIFDASGKMLLTGNTNKIETKNLIKGLYLVKINMKNGESISRKIIKK